MLEEATNLNEIYYLFLLVPDIPELIKIMSDEQFFLKLCNLNSIEQKIVNIYKIIKPKEEDNMNLLIENFQILHDDGLQDPLRPSTESISTTDISGLDDRNDSKSS